MTRKRKIPLRKCIVTNEMKPKEDMIRVVRNKEGNVFIDPTGKQNGRGAYLSKDIKVIEQAEKTGALNRQFQTKIEPSLFEELKQLVLGTPNEK
mgnify:CR=1 FL=1